MIPPAESQRHTARARFYQPSCDQEMLHQLRSAIVTIARITFTVAVAHLLIFFADIQCVTQLTGSQDPESLFVEGVHAFHHSLSVDVATKLIETREQPFSIRQTIERHPF